MKSVLSALLVGLLFGLGLGVSGMTRADKVIGFLDLADQWDPSLAFVMGGAILVHVVLYRLILQRPSPIFGDQFALPTKTDIDKRLLIGSALFGVGWALGGYCPGPGIVSASSLAPNAVVFMASLSVGMAGFMAFDRYRAS